MFEDSFVQIEHGEAAKILDSLNPKLDGGAFDPAMVRILQHDLPFYKDHSLVEVTDHDSNPPRVVTIVLKKSDSTIHILNGTNEPIYALNDEVPIFLDEESAKLYARFFFHYVRGRHGSFQIVENTDEMNWREEPAPNARKALGKMISPLTLVDDLGGEGFTFRASIIFKDSLFEASLNVSRDGLVNISDQELIVEDIPVADDSFSQ